MESGSAMQMEHVRDGVLLVRNCVPAHEQEQAFADLLGGDAPTVLPMPVTQLFSQRWKRNSPPPDTPRVRALSARIMALVYGPGGVWAALPEDGCSEDHEGRPYCACSDPTPHLPRSTELNCVDALAYKAHTQKGWHRDMNWLVALTLGNTVTMGFQRHDDDPTHVELDVPSGCAAIFNGALHRHAVLRIAEGTAPAWWAAKPVSQLFSRAVFLMRDTRQSWKASQKKLRRAAAAVEAGKMVAARIAARNDSSDDDVDDENDGCKNDVDAVDSDVLPDWMRDIMRSDRCVADNDDDDDGDDRCAPAAHPHHWRVTLVQGRAMASVAEAVAIVRVIAKRYRPDYVVFSEGSFLVPLRNGDVGHLEPIAQLTREMAIGVVLGTCVETERAKQYVTSLCFERGQMVCRYRKRRATRTGAHAEGSEVGQWQSAVLGGCPCGVLVCFDVENEQPRGEMLAAQPRIVFNPTWIPAPSPAMRAHEAAYIAGWRSAVDSMRGKFQRMCGLHNVWLARCDAAEPASGTTQLIGPYSALSVPGAGACCVTVSVDRSDDNHFGRCSRAPTRERTKLEENTGSCYDIRLFAPPPTALHEGSRLAVAASWGTAANTIVALYSDGYGASFNARDGRLMGAGAVGERVRAACFARDSVALWTGQTLAVASAADWRPSSRWTLPSGAAHVSWLSESVLLCGAAVVDVRQRDGVVATIADAPSVTSSAAVQSCDGISVLVGLQSGAATFDPRGSWSAAVSLVHSDSAVRAVDASGRWACGARVMGRDGACERVAFAPVSSLAAPFAGLANGDVLGGRHVFGVHGRRVTQLAVAADGFSALAVAPAHSGVALLQFRQNEEKQIALHNGLLLP